MLPNAIFCCDADLVQRILKNTTSADRDKIIGNEQTMLYALHHRSQKVIDVLVEYGVDINLRVPCGSSHDEHCVNYPPILIHGINSGSERLVKLMLQNGAYIPREVLGQDADQDFKKYIEEYIYRVWSPAQHLDWPIFFRKQIYTLLCCLVCSRNSIYHAQSNIRRIVVRLPKLPPTLLYRLIETIASAHFEFTD